MSLARSVTTFQNAGGQIVRFTFAARKPPLGTTVVVAEAFRAAVLSALHATTGNKESFLLSGHHEDGTPDKEHRHAYYLPQPSYGGSLAEILIVSPRHRFSPDELAAMQIVKRLRWNGPSTRVHLELVDGDDHSAVQLAAAWTSLTPYVPVRRFWGTHGKHHLTPERQLAKELENLSFGGSIVSLVVEPWQEIRVRVANKGGERGLTLSRRTGFRAVFRTAEPICGPIALGHSCHFGLGQFVPLADTSR
ncbi:MAG: type I-U CRISPR-associated protein Cas5/Cas6 [Acidobacteria bacterium]|nr:type I-U CRISPR-associated protein Cas5/Cas6 [Acidobacteriota bacterium]